MDSAFYGDSDLEEFTQTIEKWEPLKVVDHDDFNQSTSEHPSLSSTINIDDEIENLKENQENLTSSLLSLTSHFAQVQFRLKQIVDTPQEERNELLHELEIFANKGIPELLCSERKQIGVGVPESEEMLKEQLEDQRQKQNKLIQQLKDQLEDLETYAYEMGSSDVPTSTQLEKQKIVIEEVAKTLDINLKDYCKCSHAELRSVVNQAVQQIEHPGKVKEKLVDQLKTQIVDLERFVEFLQGEAAIPGPLGEKKFNFPARASSSSSKEEKVKRSKNVHAQTLQMMRKVLTVLQLFAVSQLGCGSAEFQRNVLKRTPKGNHWGDLRARLEIAVDSVIDLCENSKQDIPPDSDYTSDSEDVLEQPSSQELIQVVRKDLAPALRDLLQHGLMEVGQSSSLVTWGCFPSRLQQSSSAKMVHIWDVLVKYYEMKHGKEYNDSPARKLSMSFDLDIVGGKAITAKQQFLSAVDTVLNSHKPLKRTEDSQFKAFVCLSLNQKMLVTWLRLLLKTTSLIDFYYQAWSYVISTGFDDTLVSLERLEKQNFNLPVDVAVKQFKNIKDAF